MPELIQSMMPRWLKSCCLPPLLPPLAPNPS
jgi:hypothetical protein